MKGRIRFLSTAGQGPVGLVANWARIAAAAGFSVQVGDVLAGQGDQTDLALIAGPAPVPRPSARKCYVLDDGSPGPALLDRQHSLNAAAILCPDPDRLARLSAQGVPVQGITPAIEVWRWLRPVRPAWPQRQVVIASDAPAGVFAGLPSLPLPPFNRDTDAVFAPSIQAVALQSPETHLFHALVALATGLPLVLPPRSLLWLGPLAALRIPVEEASTELLRLARDPAAWFDQVQQGRDALRRVADPARFLDDLSALLSA